jgi:hypothetical protein
VVINVHLQCLVLVRNSEERRTRAICHALSAKCWVDIHELLAFAPSSLVSAINRIQTHQVIMVWIQIRTLCKQVLAEHREGAFSLVVRERHAICNHCVYLLDLSVWDQIPLYHALDKVVEEQLALS